MTLDQQCLIAMGGNLPFGASRPEATLTEALVRLREEGVEILGVSRFFRTPAFPAGAGPDFVNAAAVLRVAQEPEALLALLHRVEAAFGRRRETRWGQRTLDLDLIAVGGRVLPDLAGFEAWQRLTPDEQQSRAPDQLILPHPRLHERAFVLVPLADVAPDWVHPVLGRSVQQMLDDLPRAARDEVEAL
ncbi:2-amino-4-hydroxy-6-hydroxymethyldihydropteridine pyrophosphokinase [Roseovarius sp. TM1035]|jgi:2-amino-4-hydroxy-6-hydroxymethyldihydropteridine diphosphokinase|uniref:2-amino-4-hydroxy-6- hydroxymethyldihydropteridine diphosphokinase n=1 Tax=Roseovarius sp. TM1035 TaxID=391613 RepID=UPI0001557410|nr:2-amino-4-hydroxy-6-hydroxymethyldihydropteridine diphosphokinase [Roseovarius sp. TM1035]EDM33173.1 2-amino-4-hydroxy-6-hydroxymethyldihydropteridine pyrophosphokinase [Roseovarius sp. TM1035]